MSLTPKQKRFADNYIESLDPARSYMKAGYTVKNIEVAYVNAHRLLKNAKIHAYIKEIMDAQDKKTVMGLKEIFERQTKIARGEIEEEVVVTLYKKYEVVKKKASIKDQQRAMEHLAKLHGIGENVNHSGNVVFKFESDYGDNEED